VVHFHCPIGVLQPSTFDVVPVLHVEAHGAHPALRFVPDGVENYLEDTATDISLLTID
jgi:hypothetical protein